MEFTETQLKLMEENLHKSLNLAFKANPTGVLDFVHKTLVELLRQSPGDISIEAFKNLVTVLAENRGIYLPYYSPTLDLSNTQELVKSLEGISKAALIDLVRQVLQDDLHSSEVREILFPGYVCLPTEQ